MTTDAEIVLPDAQLREVRAVERALEQAETDRAKLMPGGQRLYSDEEQQRREQAIETTLQAEIERVTEQADAGVREAAAVVERFEDADPLNALSSDELAAANARAAFVKEDCTTLPLPDLARRITHALAGADKAALYLWARYGDQRLQAEQASGRVSPFDIEELHRLAAVLREAGERFIDQRAQASAKERLTRAQTFRAAVSRTVHPLLVERSVRELRGSGRYRNIL